MVESSSDLISVTLTRRQWDWVVWCRPSGEPLLTEEEEEKVKEIWDSIEKQVDHV